MTTAATAAKNLAAYLRRRASYWRDQGNHERAERCARSAEEYEATAKRLAAYLQRRAAYWRDQGDHERAERCERSAKAYV